MEDRRSAFQSLMSYVGGDELLRQHPLVAEFVGAAVRCAALGCAALAVRLCHVARAQPRADAAHGAAPRRSRSRRPRRRRPGALGGRREALGTQTLARVRVRGAAPRRA